jgi:hypothetical protein
MKLNRFLRILSISSFVFIAYTGVSAQEAPVVNETKDAAKKVKVVVTDGLEKAAIKTADVAAVATEKGKAAVKTFGNHTLVVTENVSGQALEGGKYYTVKTWDGTKWVAKQVWYATKKTAEKVKDKVDQ